MNKSLSCQIRARQIELEQVPGIKQKELEYYNYCIDHIQNVQLAWSNIKKDSKCIDLIINSNLPGSIDKKENYPEFESTLDFQISSHDNSKFKDDEWDAYRKYFYPINEDEKISASADFDFAWKHHYENNMHHWDHWYFKNMTNLMPLSYIVEMCCDWIAMSMKFGGTALDWYNSNKKKIHLGNDQETFTVELFKRYYNTYK